eukprot:Gb_14518 [translate_table: standard]
MQSTIQSANADGEAARYEKFLEAMEKTGSRMSCGRLRELFAKYGKVALGVHFSVSTITIAGFYVAIKNNVDVESLLGKIGLSSHSKEHANDVETMHHETPVMRDETPAMRDEALPVKEEGQTGNAKKGKFDGSDFLLSGGGALGLAILCNKALFPVRVPITIALTPPIARFLARRRLIKDNLR